MRCHEARGSLTIGAAQFWWGKTLKITIWVSGLDYFGYETAILLMLGVIANALD